MSDISVDLLVIGGGSGGFGAALAGARAKLNVLILEAADSLGGNANRCGVNNWEPVIGGTGYPFEIYKRLKEIDGAVGIYSYGKHAIWDGFEAIPGGEHVITPGLTYIDTNIRHVCRGLREDGENAKRFLHGVAFEPDEYESVLREMLAETGRCDVIYGAQVTGVETDSQVVRKVVTSDGRSISAGFYVDATGDGDVCEAAGCEIMTGQESTDRFDEPSAPEVSNKRVNGVTLMYRITPITNGETPAVQPLSQDIPGVCWWRDQFPGAAIFDFPSSRAAGDISRDRNLNMLPTMEGEEYLSMDQDAAYAECTRRVLAHWHWVQTGWPQFRMYHLRSMAESIGVRETRRVVCNHVLTERDVIAPLDEGYHPDTIAIADHAIDRHGKGGGAHELATPFSIPYRSIVPKGYKNLLVACRAAGFSSVAASSCRLSRTMMQLGQAAGNAVAIASETGSTIDAIDTDELRRRLADQHVQLSHPMRPELRQYLLDE